MNEVEPCCLLTSISIEPCPIASIPIDSI